MRSAISIPAPPIFETGEHFDDALGLIDELRFVDALIRTVASGHDPEVPAGCQVLVRGWALNPAPPRLADGIVAAIDRSIVWTIPYGRDRADVAQHFSNAALARSGIKSLFSLLDLPLGKHTMRILSLDAAQNGCYALGPEYPFTIVESRRLFPGTDQAGGRIQCAVEHVETVSGRGRFDGTTVDAKAGDIVVVRGWAIDRNTGSATGDVFAIVDEADYVLGIHGLPSPEIAHSLDLPSARRCRFTLRIPTRTLAPGEHQLALAVLASEGTEYAVVPIARLSLK